MNERESLFRRLSAACGSHGAPAGETLPREAPVTPECDRVALFAETFAAAAGLARELQAYAERELVPAMKAVHPGCAIETHALGILPPFYSGENSEATTLALKLAVTSYLLSLAVFIPASGWTADRFGARRVFAAAIQVLASASL